MVLGRQMVKQQSILSYGGRRSSRSWDSKEVKVRKEGREQDRNGAQGHKGLVRPLGQGAGRQIEHLHSHFKHCCSCSMLPRDADTQKWGVAGHRPPVCQGERLPHQAWPRHT